MNLPYKPYAGRTQCRHARPMNPPKKQNGVVLFIALIALVVMSLAAVALIRSVDTNTMIAGNLAFKQAATSSADSGLETAIGWLANKAAAGEAIFEADDTANGYYSTSGGDAKTLAAASTKLATGIEIGPPTYAPGTDSSGNTIRYVVQRLCRITGVANTANCLYGAPSDPTSSKGNKDVSDADPNLGTGTSVMFRVTISVAGPKNTLGFIQAYVY
jgi:hypothetical protein